MKRRLFSLLLCLVLLLAACGRTASGAQEPAAEPLQEPTAELNVYVAAFYNDRFLDTLVWRFRQDHPDVELNIVAVEWGIEEESEKLPAELAAGRGPDLYIGTGAEFRDLFKVMASGTFCDLTPYLENMESFDRSNYVQSVIDGGILRGKQYIMPLSWEYPGLVTTREALEDAGISPEELGTFSGLMYAAQKYMEENDGTHAFSFNDNGWSFLTCADGVQLNYETLQANADTAEFREMVDAFGSIYALNWGGEYTESNAPFYDAECAFSTLNRTLLFKNLSVSYLSSTTPAPVGIGEAFGYLTKDETPLLLPVPTVDGKALADIYLFAAINANSKNKANAADFLELLLEKEVQDLVCGIFTPVHQGLLEERAAGLRRLAHPGDRVRDSAGNLLATSANISEEEADQLLSTLLNLDGVRRTSGTVTNFVFTDMEPYWKGEKSYEECLQKLQLDLTIYISE